MKDATQIFDDGAFDDPVAELARLKQGSSLVDYLEKFDNLLARVMVSDEMALSFFLWGLTVRLEKSVRLHIPITLQEAMQLAYLQEDILQELTKEIHGVSMGSLEEQHKNFKIGNQS